MEEIFKKLIEQLNSSVFVLLGILAASFWAVFRLAKLIEQFAHHKTKIEKVDDLSDKLVELKVKVDLIYQNTNPNRTVAAASPIGITPTGKEISAKISAEQILCKYFGSLSDMVEATSPKNAYDIQTSSMAIAREKMINLLNADEINAVKAVAYSKGLLAEDVMAVPKTSFKISALLELVMSPYHCRSDIRRSSTIAE
jgi:hypothetical protein